jgi:hypothetical protein
MQRYLILPSVFQAQTWYVFCRVSLFRDPGFNTHVRIAGDSWAEDLKVTYLYMGVVVRITAEDQRPRPIW